MLAAVGRLLTYVIWGPQPGPPAPRRPGIGPEVRNQVWLHYHGERARGLCYCCGIQVQRYNAGWHCAHVISDTRGGAEALHNLRTTCAGCNLSMGNQNLYAFIRDRQLRGPGAANVQNYFRRYPDQRTSQRTNNRGRP